MAQNDHHMSRSERQAVRQLTDTVERALSNEDTRLLLRWVLEVSGVNEVSYDGNANGTIYREGRRSVGLEVIQLLNVVDPLAYVRLMQEGANEIVRKRSKAQRAELEGARDEDR